MGDWNDIAMTLCGKLLTPVACPEYAEAGMTAAWNIDALSSTEVEEGAWQMTLLDDACIDLHDLRQRPRKLRTSFRTSSFSIVDTYEGQVTDPNTLHKYIYGNDNPVMYTDPTGMASTGEITVGMGILVLLNVLMFPNVANAPGPKDVTEPDRGGDMALAGVISVPVVGAATVAVRFVVSPLVRWGGGQISKLFGRAPVVTTRLYRVVSEAEYAQITKTGKMLPDPAGKGFQTGKWFWREPEAAAKWVELNPGAYGSGYRIIAADVPPDILSTAMQRANLDQVGDAVFLTIDDLMSAAVKEAAK